VALKFALEKMYNTGILCSKGEKNGRDLQLIVQNINGHEQNSTMYKSSLKDSTKWGNDPAF